MSRNPHEMYRLNVEVCINVMPHESAKDTVDRIAKVFAYALPNMEVVVRCPTLTADGLPIEDAAMLDLPPDDANDLLGLPADGLDLLNVESPPPFDPLS